MTGEPPKVLEHTNERFAAFTGKTSDAVRALGISGVGIAWLLAGGAQATDAAATLKALRLMPALAASLVLSMLVLLLDAAQFAWASFGWGIYSWVLGRIWQARKSSWNDEKKAQWWLSTALGIDRLILGAPLPDGSRVDRAKSAAEALDLMNETVESRLKQPYSPKFINRGSGIFFWLKILAALSAYGCLVAYVLGVLSTP